MRPVSLLCTSCHLGAPLRAKSLFLFAVRDVHLLADVSAIASTLLHTKDILIDLVHISCLLKVKEQEKGIVFSPHKQGLIAQDFFGAPRRAWYKFYGFFFLRPLSTIEEGVPRFTLRTTS